MKPKRQKHASATTNRQAALKIPLTDTPCPRCLALYREGKIRGETVMPLPAGAFAPLIMGSRGKCCRDCAAADGLLQLGLFSNGTDRATAFAAARVVVGNDRQEQLRLPGASLGLVAKGLISPSAPGDMQQHHVWLAKHGIELRYPIQQDAPGV